MSLPSDDPQTHLIYLLLDSNLPTGGFVASSGLESWVKHGFLANGVSQPNTSTAGTRVIKVSPASRITDFVDAEVENYARATGWYVREGWRVVDTYLRGKGGRGRCAKCGQARRKISSSEVESDGRSSPTAPLDDRLATTPESNAAPVGRPALQEESNDLDQVLDNLLKLDKYHEATLLSHVSRRASKAQGVAILTLYTKGLSRPAGIDISDDLSQEGEDLNIGRRIQEKADTLVDGYKRLIRRGKAPGHLAVCWGLMTAALGLNLEISYHLYLFLHARSLVSAAVRLNSIGPYLSSQLLLHPIKGIIERHSIIPPEETQSGADEGCSCAAQRVSGAVGREEEGVDEDFWAWTKEAEEGPTTTWPLGEVLIARHDLQHSRIFNS